MLHGIVASTGVTFIPPIGTDYFVENGSNKPFYTSATFPAATHDAANEKTWMAYEGWGTGRSAFVTYYDHAALSYGPTVSAGEIELTDDSHGMPAICRDADGYLHVFFGPHSGNMKYRVSTNADSNLAWTAKSDISGSYTYPNPVLVGSTIYLFMRKTSTSFPMVLRPITGISSGSGTVGSEVVLADPGGTDRFYIGPCFAIGTDIHIVGTISNQANTDRWDLFYLVYDTTTGAISNHDGSTTVSSGSLPLGRATLDANFRLVDTAGSTGTQAGFCFDSAGNAHVAWLDGSGSSFNINHMIKSGGSWSSPTVVSTTDTSELPLALVAADAGAVELWFAVDTGGTWAVGGDMARAIRPAGGPWGAVTVVIAAADRAFLHATPVLNGDSTARLLFDEVAQTDTNGDAGNKVYLRSAAGYIRRGIQGSATAAILSAFSSVPGAARQLTIDRLVFDLEQTGIWSKLDALWMLAAHNSAAALVNWKNPGTFDMTLHGSPLPSFVTDAYFETNGSTNYLNTNFNPTTAGGSFTQNSAIFGIISATASSVAASSAGWFDGTDGVTIRPHGGGTGFAARINSAASYDSGVVPSGSGGYFANRSASDAAQNYRNGKLHGSTTTASAAMNSAAFRLGNASSGSFAALRFRAAFLGGSLTAAEVRTLYDCLTAYLQGVGAI